MATVYTTKNKEYPEDYKLSERHLDNTKRRLREKLKSDLPGSSEITMGNYVLGRDFAWDYLHYLEDGGEFGIEGFRKFVWNPEQNMKRFFQRNFT